VPVVRARVCDCERRWASKQLHGRRLIGVHACLFDSECRRVYLRVDGALWYCFFCINGVVHDFPCSGLMWRALLVDKRHPHMIGSFLSFSDHSAAWWRRQGSSTHDFFVEQMPSCKQSADHRSGSVSDHSDIVIV